MNYYLKKFTKNNKHKQKINLSKGFVVFSIIGIAIGGVAKRLIAQRQLEDKNNVIQAPKNGDEDINIKREEIKHTLEEYGEEVVGDVGVAMEKALEGLEAKKQNDNELKK